MLNRKGLAKDHLGQVLSQPCCYLLAQINFNWWRFDSTKNVTRCIESRSGKKKQKKTTQKQWRKAFLRTGK